MSGLFSVNPLVFLIWMIALLIAITVHEFAHAWTAVRLGDPTPKLQGRVTLNPLAHLDPFGSLLPVLLFLSGSRFIFGWGKPVMFDPYNLENPKRDAAIISLAGPLSNMILAAILSVLFYFTSQPFSPLLILNLILPQLIVFNVVLAVFNLIPIHPLDGGKILVGLLPEKEAHGVDKFLRQYGVFILILLIIPFYGTSPVNALISPIINFLVGILMPTAQFN